MKHILENTGKFSDKIVLNGEYVEKHIPIELKSVVTEKEIHIMNHLSSEKDFPLITKQLYVDNSSMDDHIYYIYHQMLKWIFLRLVLIIVLLILAI